MCTTLEMVAFVSTGGTLPGSDHWIATGYQTRESAGNIVNDCSGWTVGNTGVPASMWNAIRPTWGACNGSAPIACCE